MDSQQPKLAIPTDKKTTIWFGIILCFIGVIIVTLTIVVAVLSATAYNKKGGIVRVVVPQANQYQFKFEEPKTEVSTKSIKAQDFLENDSQSE